MHLSQNERSSTIRRSKLTSQNYGIRNCLWHRRDDRTLRAGSWALPARRLGEDFDKQAANRYGCG
jgi:hypothetical protein